MSIQIGSTIESFAMADMIRRNQESLKKIRERYPAGGMDHLAAPTTGSFDSARISQYRTDLVSVRARQSNIQGGLSLLQRGEVALDQMRDILGTVRDKISALEGMDNLATRRRVNEEVELLLADFEEIAQSTQYNGIHLFNRASSSQTRMATVTAPGAGTFEETFMVDGGDTVTERFTADTETREVSRAVTAGMPGTNGGVEPVDLTFPGGYLDDVQETTRVTAESQEIFELGGIPEPDTLQIAVNGQAIPEAGTGGGIVFDQDFAGGAGGLTVDGGTATVQDGQLQIRSEKRTHATAMTGVTADTATVEVDFNTRTDKMLKKRNAMVVFGYQDENNYFRVGSQESSDRLTIEQITNGKKKTVASVKEKVGTATDYNLRVELDGENVRLFLNDELKMDENVNGLQAGQIGLGVHHGVTNFDNFQIETPGADGFIQDGNNVSFTGDTVPRQGDEVTFNYQTPQDYEEFDLGLEEGVTPNADTLQVTVNGQVVEPDQYTMEGDTLTFTGDVRPGYGDEVGVGFQTGAELTEIDLDQVLGGDAPNEGTLQVFKNGIQLAQDDENGYTVEGDVLRLNGEGRGDADDQYEIRYQTEEAFDEITLQNEPAGDGTAGEIGVTVNGVEIQQDALNGFTIEGDTLRLHGDAVPALGDEIEVQYQVGDEMRSVELEQEDVLADTVKVFVNGQELARDEENGFTVEGNVVNFNGTAAPQTLDQVTVQYETDGERLTEFELERTPEAGTFSLSLDGRPIREDEENGFTIDGRTVRLHGDAIPEGGEVLEVKYRFTGGEGDEAGGEPIILTTVNGDRLTTAFPADFTREGLSLDTFNLDDRAGAQQALSALDSAVNRVDHAIDRTKFQQQELGIAIDTLGHHEERLGQYANLPAHRGGYSPDFLGQMVTEMLTNLATTLLAQGDLNSQRATSLLDM